MDQDTREMVDEILKKNQQLCDRANAVLSGLNEGSAKIWRGMTHAERRLRYNIDVMTEVMGRLSRDVRELQVTLKPVVEKLVELGSDTRTSAMTPEEASAYLSCNEGTLRVWTSKRKIPFVKVGRLTRFRRRDLDRWMSKRLVKEWDPTRGR